MRREGYTIVLIGHDGHEEVVGHARRGARRDRPRRVRRGCRGARRRRPATRRLRHADDAVGRRDRARSSPRCGGASRTSTRRRKRTSATRPPNRQSAVKEMLAEVDLLLVIGSREQLELEPARRGRARRWRRRVPDRRRDRHRRGVARRRRRRSALTLGRVRAGVARRARLATGSGARRRDVEAFAMVTRTCSSACPSSCGASSSWPRRRVSG